MREILGKRLLKHFCIINLLVKSKESIQLSCSKRTRPAGTHYCQVGQTDTDEICMSEKCCLQMQHLFFCIKRIRRRRKEMCHVLLSTENQTSKVSCNRHVYIVCR
jgi:hypothetical protein